MLVAGAERFSSYRSKHQFSHFHQKFKNHFSLLKYKCNHIKIWLLDYDIGILALVIVLDAQFRFVLIILVLTGDRVKKEKEEEQNYWYHDSHHHANFSLFVVNFECVHLNGHLTFKSIQPQSTTGLFL